MSKKRDTLLDGFRAAAAIGITVEHAVAYRYKPMFEGVPDAFWNIPTMLSQGVLMFFIISGYIITFLLEKEQKATGRVNVGAFYLRRTLRIWPCFFAYLAVIFTLAQLGYIVIAPTDFLVASTFTCNVGFYECSWDVAHTWTTAIQEQYYLLWPLLFLFLGFERRAIGLIAIIAACVVWFILTGFKYHHNAISIATIALGALYAVHEPLRNFIARWAIWPVWIPVAAFYFSLPIIPGDDNLLMVFSPFLVLYVVFACRDLTLWRIILQSKPMQMIGAFSFSLYLWQQLFVGPTSFLGEPRLIEGQFSIFCMPVAIFLSYQLLEKPSIRLSTYLSGEMRKRKIDDGVRAKQW